MGRRWHFFFAWILVLNGLVYFAYLIGRRHIRDLWPSAADIRAIPRAIVDHARLRFPEGDEALHYNVLQKLAYLSVVDRLSDPDPRRAHDVAGDGRGFPVAADPLRRAPGGARRAFPARDLSRSVRHRASRDGRPLGSDQQHALDDHWPVSHQGGSTMTGEASGTAVAAAPQPPQAPPRSRRGRRSRAALGAADAGSPAALSILEKAEALTKAVQRALLAPRTALAVEYPQSRDHPHFQAERLDRSRRSRLCRSAPGRFRRLEARGRRPRRTADEVHARRLAQPSVAVADHPA